MGDITFNPETGLYERKAGGKGRPRGEHGRGQESNSSAGTRGEEQEAGRVEHMEHSIGVARFKRRKGKVKRLGCFISTKELESESLPAPVSPAGLARLNIWEEYLRKMWTVYRTGSEVCGQRPADVYIVYCTDG